MSNSEDVRNLVRVEEAVQPRPPQYKSKVRPCHALR